MAQSKKDHKRVLLEAKDISAVLRGAKIAADTVAVSYGPRGKNVLIEKSYGNPVLTRDGVTILKETYSEVRDENMGMGLLREAAEQTVRVVGDGTTQTGLLTYELWKLGQRKITDDGANPMDVKQSIIEDSYKLLKNLESMKQDVKKGQLEQVATVSSGDPLLGKLIAGAVEEVGADGGIITEKAAIAGVDRSYVSGYFLQQGFHAIEAGKKEIENCYVVVSSKPISSKVDAVNLIGRVGEKAHQDQELATDQPLKNAISIAVFGEISGDAYDVIVANINAGAFNGTITKTPPLGELGPQYLEDLAIFCGAKSIRSGENLANVTVDYIGSAEKVSCTTTETTIFGGGGAKEDVDARKAELKERLKTESLEAIQEKIRDRIAKLEGKVALFKIGGATENEREEKEYRIEDSIQSTRAAAQNGVVTGGGITLLKLSKTEGIGDVTRQALRDVFKRLMHNANLPAELKLEQALDAPEGFGFNLREGDELVDLVASGILDPYMVVREVVTNAVSIAAGAVTIGAVIVFSDSED